MPTNLPTGSTLVATVAGGPQVVTFALDELLRRGEPIREVIAVHLSPQADPLTGHALAKLTAEFPGDRYAGQPCRLRFCPIRAGSRKLDDIRNDADVNAAYNIIRKAFPEAFGADGIEGAGLHPEIMIIT